MKLACLDISTIPKPKKAGKSIIAALGEEKYRLQLSDQKTGFGIRKFFVCPECGQRKTKLFIEKTSKSGFKCADCMGLNLYKPIQNGTKGGYREIEYRMERYAAKRGIIIKKWPFAFFDYDDDPRYHKSSFQKALKILQALENMRGQNIFFKTTYKLEKIKTVLTGKHPNLQRYSIFELQRYYYRF
nr:MAG TPA: NUDIX domain protein [Caudoviricetes sp.]